MVQWLGIRLPMQGTWVRSLVWEDPTCCRTAKLMCLNYWAHVLESDSHSCWSPRALQPVFHNKRSHHGEKPVHHDEKKSLHAATRENLQQWRPSAAKNKYMKMVFKNPIPFTRTEGQVAGQIWLTALLSWNLNPHCSKYGSQISSPCITGEFVRNAESPS